MACSDASLASEFRSASIIEVSAGGKASEPGAGIAVIQAAVARRGIGVVASYADKVRASVAVLLGPKPLFYQEIRVSFASPALVSAAVIAVARALQLIACGVELRRLT